MSQQESWRNRTVLLAIMIVISLGVALWPTIAGQLGDPAARVDPELQLIDINLPFAIGDTNTLTLTNLQAVGALAGIIFAFVVGAGFAVTGLNYFLARQVTSVKESDEYQAREKILSDREQEKIKALRAERSTKPKPEHTMPRWSVVSTSLIILLFVIFFGMFINGALVPAGEYRLFGSLVNSAIPVVGGFVVVTVIILLWLIRPQRLASIEETNDGPIPWDSIFVVISGLIVVGLGLALVVYLNLG